MRQRAARLRAVRGDAVSELPSYRAAAVRHRRGSASRSRERVSLPPVHGLPRPRRAARAASTGSRLWSARRPALAWFRRARPPRRPARAAAPTRPRAGARAHRHRARRADPAAHAPALLRALLQPGQLLLLLRRRRASACEAVVADVTNTPWGERHAYVMRRRRRGRPRHASTSCAGSFEKQLHVSPLMGMDHIYDWRLTEPGEQLSVHIESRARRRRRRSACSTRRSSLRAPRADAARAAPALARYPFLTRADPRADLRPRAAPAAARGALLPASRRARRARTRTRSQHEHAAASGAAPRARGAAAAHGDRLRRPPAPARIVLRAARAASRGGELELRRGRAAPDASATRRRPSARCGPSLRGPLAAASTARCCAAASGCASPTWTGCGTARTSSR